MSKFFCARCHFFTDTNGQLKQHSLTKKHLKIMANNDDVISPYKCSKCERGYQTKSGLQKHKAVCKAPEVVSIEAVVPVAPIPPEIVNIDLHAKIDNLGKILLFSVTNSPTPPKFNLEFQLWLLHSLNYTKLNVLC